MTKGMKLYKEKENALRKECEELVKNSEMTQEDAHFRFFFKRDELLDEIPDALFEIEEDDE